MSTFCGLSNDEKSSSRILKPPGGGHSNIFGPPDAKTTHARPKYDQQNSSNISGALGTTDANAIAEQTARVIEEQHAANEPTGAGQRTNGDQQSQPAAQQQAAGGRSRVPPGGFSSGFW